MEDNQKWTTASTPRVGRTFREHPCRKVAQRSSRELAGVTACCALSLFSLGVCLLGYLRTSELQSRVLNLERERDTRLSAWVSPDQVEPVILGKLDQILEEKLAARLPRMREAREAPHSCICPPGRSLATMHCL
ncbi:collagen alpha-1(XIII) chain isoform X1 [Arapaima gigas]